MTDMYKIRDCFYDTIGKISPVAVLVASDNFNNFKHDENYMIDSVVFDLVRKDRINLFGINFCYNADRLYNKYNVVVYLNDIGYVMVSPQRGAELSESARNNYHNIFAQTFCEVIK